jgi:hypothetical protein
VGALFFQSAASKTLLKFIDAATDISHFLVASVERVAGSADIQADIAAQRRAGIYYVAAAASRCNSSVFWMDVGFHG